MSRLVANILTLLTMAFLPLGASAAQRPNLLLITVDDMNADSTGAFGSPVPATTPNIDRLADQGLRFTMAHVQVANCMPSRNVMWSGRYPHGNGIEGFIPLPEAHYPTLGELLSGAGYHTAILGKVNHSTPYRPYPWDSVLDELPDIRARDRYHKDPRTYAIGTRAAIAAARERNRPFALMINVSDPHEPFYGYDRRGRPVEDPYTPSRTFAAAEVAVPGFLPDDPMIREELSHYYSSVRRADDAVGYVLDALDEAGAGEKTLVVFLSDHGMPLPFGKTQLYHHSTHTPLILRWPGVIRPGSVDDRHMVSAVDLLPTLLEAIGEPLPAGLQGESFNSLLRGGEQRGRDSVFKVYNENGAGRRTPMRAVQTRDYLYIYNPWSDGVRRMHSATVDTITFTRMQALAATDQGIAARLDLLVHRVPEELYDMHSDPDCLVNLVGDPERTLHAERMRTLLSDWMRRTGDPVYEVFQRRSEPAVRTAYMVEQDAISKRHLEARRKARKQKGRDAGCCALPEK